MPGLRNMALNGPPSGPATVALETPALARGPERIES